ncbi:phage portal protein [Aeromonas caviae]|uniref:phage portal protein n=1 Tax=Aeromonas caviae TaxID=648 RepID=UPI00225A9929|nr:phage portal protein [Aeromonas caviae]MCX4071940.1 phage portal protein [Aeromonas caviae]
MLFDINGNPLFVNNYADLQLAYQRYSTDDISISVANYCRQLIANSVSRLSLNLYKETNKGREEVPKTKYPKELKAIARNPNDFQTWPQFIRSCTLNTLDHGNGYGVAERNALNSVAYIMPVENAQAVTVRYNTGVLTYDVPQGAEFKLNKQRYLRNEVIHMKGLNAVGLKGVGIHVQNKSAFDIMQRAERHGRNWFDNAVNPTGVFEMPDSMTPQQYKTESEAILGATKGQKNAGSTLFLKPGIKFQAIQADHKASQFIETREFQKREILNAYGVPQGMLMEGSADYDKAQMAFFKGTVFSYCREFEDALNRICPEGFFFEFDTDEFIKGDPQQQITYIRDAVNACIMTPNEGRKYMGYEPVEDGDVFAVQTNNITLGTFTEVKEYQKAQREALQATPAPQGEQPQPADNGAPADINTTQEADNGTAE